MTNESTTETKTNIAEPPRKKSVAFAVVKDVTFCVITSVAALALISSTKRSWAEKTLKAPVFDKAFKLELIEMSTVVSAFNIFTGFGWGATEKARRHNRAIDENNGHQK